MTDPEAAPVNPGDIVAGKYRVERVLGKGGMGLVVAATHLDLNALVALKFLLPKYATDPSRIARFTQEARAAIRIKSEHVAHVLDLGRVDPSTPFIVMEHLDGHDLASQLDRLGPMSVSEATSILLQACEALAEAHALGVVHRDLKPSNLFVCKKGDGSTTLKIMDFGISKIAPSAEDDPDRVSITRTGGMVGSPSYMAPEQIRNAKAVDGRADIWSLGVLLFELISARHPFENHSVGGLLSAILVGPHLPLSAVWPQAPHGLQDIIDKCLQKDAAERFQTAAEFAQALGPFASCSDRIPACDYHALGATETTVASDTSAARVQLESSVAPHAIALSPATPGPSQPQSPPTIHHPIERAHPSQSRRTMWIVAAVACLVLVSVVGWHAGRTGASPLPTPPAASPTAPHASSLPTASASSSPAAGASIAPIASTPGPRVTATSHAPPKASPSQKAPPAHSAHELEGLIDERK